MKLTPKKVGRMFLWGVFALFVLILGAVAILQHPQVQERVFAEVTERVNTSLAGEFSAEGISGSLLADATIHGVRIDDARGNPVLRADYVEARYSIIPLLLGQNRLDALGVREGTLHVTRYGDGTLNLEQVRREEAPAGDAFDIFRMSVADGRLIYKDRTPPNEQQNVATVGDIDLVGQVPDVGDDAMRAEFAGAGFELEAGALDQPVPVYATDLTVERRGDEFEMSLDELDVGDDSGLESLAVRGRLAAADGDDPGGVEHVSGDVDPLTVTPELAANFAPDLELASPVVARAEFSGALDDIDIRGDVTTRDGGTVDFDGNLAPNAPAYDITLETDDFNPDAWVESEAPFALSRAEVSATGNLDEADIDFDLDGVETDELTVDGLEGTASLGGLGAADGSMTYDVDAAATSLAGEQFKFAAVDVDLEGLIVPSRADDARYPLEHLVADGTVGIQQMSGAGLRARSVDTNVDISGPVPSLSGAVATEFDELFVEEYRMGAATLDVDFRQGQAFRLDARGVPEVMPQLPLFLRAGGSYSDTFDVWSLSNLQIGRPSLNWRMPEPTRLVVDDGQITFDGLTLERGDRQVTIDGTYPLEGRSIVDIIEQLGVDELRELIEGDLLDDRLPDEVRERIPDRIDADEAREEAEDEVRDRLRDRIPSPEDLF